MTGPLRVLSLGVPLAEVSLRPEDDGHLGFDFECEGLCGI